MKQNLSNPINREFLDLSSNKIEKLKQFSELVVLYNQKANLISKKDEKKIYERHIIDSLQINKLVLEFQKNINSLADMGSGSGFPVIPLSIVKPTIQFYAIEPRKKRSTFLKIVKEEISIPNIEIISDNVENSSLKNMDCVSSRALGSYFEDYKRSVLLLKKNGLFITFKKTKICDEIDLNDWNVYPYTIPGEKDNFCLLTRYKNYD